MNFPRFLRARLLPLASAFVMVVGMTVATNYVLSPVLAGLYGNVRIGVNGKLPGWSDRPDKGEVFSSENAAGFDVELARFLQRKFGFKLELVELTPVQRETELRAGRVDLVIANYSIYGPAIEKGRQRMEVLDFAGPYYNDVSGIMYSRGKWEELGLSGPGIPRKYICVSEGTTALEDYLSRGQVLEQQECFRRFADPAFSDVVAVSTDQSLLAAYTAQKNADRGDGGIGVDVERFGDVVYPSRDELYGIAMRNDQPLLCELLADAIQEFLNDRENGWDRAFQDHLGSTGLESGKHKPTSARCHD